MADQPRFDRWRTSGHDDAAYPAALRGLEADEVGGRRLIWSAAGRDDDDHEGPVGIALSGGGIRSATFCLGFFQALGRARLLDRVDFLSTVSGGGYFGGFLGRMFHNKLLRAPQSSTASSAAIEAAAHAADAAEQALADPSSPEVEWLRDNGRYLAPGGSGDLVMGAAVIVRNWVAVLYVLGIAALTLLLLVRLPLVWWPDVEKGLLGAVFDLSSPRSIMWSPWCIAPLATLALMAFPLGWVYFLVFPRRLRGVEVYVSPWVTVTAALSTLVVAAVTFVLGPGGMLFAGLGRRVDGVVEPGSALSWVCVTVFGSCAIACLVWCVTIVRFRVLPTSVTGTGSGAPVARGTSDRAHGWLAGALARSLTVVLGVTAIAALDTAGGTLYYWMRDPAVVWAALGSVVSVLGGLAAFGSKISVLVSGRDGSDRVPLPWKALATVLAGLALSVLLVAVAAIAHGFCWGFGTSSSMFTPAVPAATYELRTMADHEIRIEPVADATRVPAPKGEASIATPRLALAACALFFVLTLLLGHVIPFLNYSSHHELYGGRLTRAYLGASNPRRVRTGPAESRIPVLAVDPGDDLPMVDYRPSRGGGPIHLVNVTINETVSPKTGLVAGDQRGLGMAVSPNAISVGSSNHVVRRLAPLAARTDSAPPADREEVETYPTSGFQIFAYRRQYRGEPLTLGQWVAISGAAFSTGLGVKTSLGMSLLCGLANVRLGYWWDSGIDPRRRSQASLRTWFDDRGIDLAAALPVQTHLLDEWLARFHGINRRRWNLSDGGHFNNLGAYELIRRRLPLIVAIDAEADPDNTFEALSDLIRRVRVDFGADIRFLNRQEIAPLLGAAGAGVIGELADLARVGHSGTAAVPDGPESTSCATDRSTTASESTPADVWCRTGSPSCRRSRAHAAVAEITFGSHTTPGEGPATSLLLYVKASLTGDEPTDVLQYQRVHPAFPHETTADQFFDDAQWESYRALGDHVGDTLVDVLTSSRAEVGSGPLAALLGLARAGSQAS